MSKIKSNTAAAKPAEAVEVAPKAKVVQNPANATARTTYEPVVHSTGTIDGKPARLAWYGTKYGCIEIEQADGTFTVHHDTAFGGLRSVAALEGLFDSVAPAVVAVVEVVEAPIPVVEFVAPAPSDDVVEAVAVLPAPVIAAEPVLTTLDEVRAAHEAETRGACRASVLRALRVRAGEIALGVPAGGKAAKAASEPKPGGKWSVWAAEQSANLDDMDEIVVPFADLVAAGFGESATKYAACWSAESSTAGRALAAVGLRGKLTKDGVKITKL